MPVAELCRLDPDDESETTFKILTLVFGGLAVGLVLLLIWGARPERRTARQSDTQSTAFTFTVRRL
jgi:hypothetical protein